MYNNMRVYKVGDIYKYVSIPVRQIDKEKFKNDFIKSFNQDYQRKLCNLVRCKTTINDLVLCNDFKFFITITFNNNFNRFDLKDLRKRVNNKIRRLRQNNSSLKLDFLFVPEKHKNGAWHFHGFLSNDFIYFMNISKNHKYLDCEIFDYFGFNNVEILFNKNVAKYVTKYITKDFESREKGEHFYFASQGLNRPELIENFVYNSPFFDNIFWNYKTDYCYMTYVNKHLYLHDLLKF